MAVSNLNQVVKVHVVNILTIDLYPLIAHQRKNRFLPRHFIIAKLRSPLFLLRHPYPPRKIHRLFQSKSVDSLTASS